MSLIIKMENFNYFKINMILNYLILIKRILNYYLRLKMNKKNPNKY